MAENGSVGFISLDLVIKEKLTEQLDRIKAKVSAPAEKTGEAMREAIEKPAEKAAEAVRSSMDKAVSAEKGAAEKLTGIVDEIVSKIKEMLSNVDFSTGMEQKFSAAFDAVFQKVDLMQKRWQEVSDGDSLNGLTDKLNSAAKALDEAAAKLGSIRQPEPVVPDKPVPEQYGERWEKSFKKVRSSGSRAFSYLRDAGGRAVTSLNNKLSSLAKPVQKFGSSIKNTFKRVFLAASIYAAFRAVKDGILDVVKADEQFSKSLNEVKQNLAVAFAPIMQAIMPALNSLMSGLAAVTRQIAAFIAGLFGKTYKEAAAAAQKLKDVTAAAKKAKLATAGIDEMNILSSGDEDKSNSSFTDVPEPEQSGWAEKLKNALRSGDWASVGAALANGINKALGSVNWDKVSAKVSAGAEKIADGINGFLDNIDWGTLGDTVAGGMNTVSNAIYTFNSRTKWDKLGSGIAAGLNRAIKKTNWNKLGKALGSSVQSVISTAYSFAVNFDWSGFGNAIGETINGWFSEVDFKQAAQTLSLGIAGVFAAMSGAVEAIDWKQIGNKLIDGVAGIDFGAVASRFFRLWGAALAAKLTLTYTAISRAAKAIGKYFSGKIEDCGGNIVRGLFVGIRDALVNVGTWIYNNIFKPFINGFKCAFGIASPSKVMAEMGGYIIDGLCEGVSDGIKQVREIFTKVLEAIKGVFTGIGEWFSSTFSSAWSSAESAFSDSDAGAHFRNVVSSIRSAFTGFGAFFHEKFNGAWKNITAVFNSTGKYFSGVYESISNAFKNIPEKIGGYFSSAFDKIRSALSELVDWADNKLSDMPFVGEVYSGAKSLIKKAVSKLPLPHLASGGIATAPTLAMIGDNSNARIDPEVVSPLSKLREMTGADPEIVELLKIIVELLRSGMNIEIINYMFRNSREFSREVIRAVAEDNARRGG